MENINSWAISVSICSVIVCIAETMYPDARYDKVKRFVMGSLILCAIIQPLKDGISINSDLSLEPDKVPQADMDEMKQLRYDYMEKMIIQAVSSKLEENGISVQSVFAEVVYSEDDAVQNVKLTVNVPVSEKTSGSKIRRAVSDVIGEKADVRINVSDQ